MTKRKKHRSRNGLEGINLLTRRKKRRPKRKERRVAKWKLKKTKLKMPLLQAFHSTNSAHPLPESHRLRSSHLHLISHNLLNLLLWLALANQPLVRFVIYPLIEASNILLTTNSLVFYWYYSRRTTTTSFPSSSVSTSVEIVRQAR